jgi:uncharacterized SAM-dependent methyltransferase
MGPDMYYDHKGTYSSKDGQGRLHEESMSGVRAWEKHAKYGTIPRLSQQLFLAKIRDVASSIEAGMPIIEYGPGMMDDARQLIEATKSKLYIPVDLSEAVIEQAAELASSTDHCQIRPIIMDFFGTGTPSLINEPALAALLGLTITNIPGAVPAQAPKEKLIGAFRNLSRPIGRKGGHLLISTHAEQNGERNRDFYNEEWHRKFGINFLYRMQAELPLYGFNPDHFEYLPIWHEHCSLLAHTIRATHDQDFKMGRFAEITLSVKAGEVFHYNNSFKYAPDFFETCADAAGLKFVRRWEDEASMMLYLFTVAPVIS